MSRKEDIFRYVLTNAYSHTNFVDFTREIISGLSLKAYDREIRPYNTFSAYISKYYMIGDFTDPDGNSVGVFSVELFKGESVERARTAQRNFVKSLLENGSYAAALVAFYSSDNDKWRFSFVRMDYEFAKGKIKENLTPARRYSYLVGKGEPCHTAMDRLLPIFMDDSRLPTIDEIEEAFSVEKVTKDFFEAYKEKYLQLADYLEKNEDFTREAKVKGFTTEQFTKKLLSQIVFLYFIQKKGWLGVNAVPKVMSEKEYKNAFFSHGRMSRELVGKVYFQDGDVYRLNGKALQSLSDEDETEFSKCVKGQPWGTGPKNFMRMIFENAVKRGQNFFDDCLEPLFYTGLNKDRGENAFFPPLHCRIPFLNGGLFEELDHYDWQYNDFAIPNEIFSNIAEKGRAADGILDIFDRYNFTMAEDEPLEKEVAVDPEMLGKVFENLLEVRDRKSKGAFYTPREIVHYMCSESLINYLVTKTGIPEDDIRKFITLGEFFKDEDARRSKYNSDTKKYEYDFNKKLEMPETILDFQNNINRLNEIDNYLACVRVVDPAVGSGAFPLGLLNEIVRARDTLTTYMAIPMNGFQRKMLYAQRSQYQLKTQTIKNCIFACDIEPSATDITKLRLWLALVIEDEIGDQENDEFGEHTKPRKLPNLDCNVLCGNSLNETFEGIKLICNTEALGNSITGTNISISDKAIEGHINSLIELQDSLYNARTTEEKEEIKKNIQLLYDAIIMEQLYVNPSATQKYSDPDIRRASSKPFILWQLYFPKVFKDNGGFDICIGNPPYIKIQNIDNAQADLLKKNYESATGKFDMYVLFIERAFSLITQKGICAYIQPHRFLNVGYGSGVRNFLKKRKGLNKVVNFGVNQIFDSATTYTGIFFYQDDSEYIRYATAESKDFGQLAFERKNWDELGKQWSFDTSASNSVVKKINNCHTKLLDIFEGIYQGLITLGDDIFILKGSIKGDLFEGFSAELQKDVVIEAGAVKPLLKGENIRRYTQPISDMYVLYPHKINEKGKTVPLDEEEFKSLYPRAYEYITTFKDYLQQKKVKYKTNPKYWYSLHRAREKRLFESRKIITPQLQNYSSFAYDTEQMYPDAGGYMLIIKDEYKQDELYYYGILNSSLFYHFIVSTSTAFSNNYYYFKTAYIEPFRFPDTVSDEQKEYISERAFQILNLKKQEPAADVSLLEKEIDEMVYALYNITVDERQSIIEKYNFM